LAEVNAFDSYNKHDFLSDFENGFSKMKKELVAQKMASPNSLF
jgi:hypothetical protein